jgi:hypothetical protein
MLKRQSKALSRALIFVFCMSFMFAGFAAPDVASASSTVVPNGQIIQATPGGTFNSSLLVTVSEYAFTGAGPYDFRVTLPAGYRLTNGAADFAFAVGGTQADTSIDITTGGVVNISAAPVAGTTNAFTVSVTANGPTIHKKGQFTMTMNNINVPAGASEDVKVKIEAAPGSPFTSQDVTIANVGVGKVAVSIDDVDIITSANSAATNTINLLRIKEDRAGALQTGTNSFRLKLPVGYTWANTAGVATTTAITNVWGDAAVTLALTTLDSNRTLEVTPVTAAPPATALATTAPTYWEISGLQILIDESVAAAGDVVARVSGRTGYNVGEITLAKFGEFDVKAEPVGDPTKVVAGKFNQEIGAFQIEEVIGGSLVNNRTITLELVGNAKWVDGNASLVGMQAAGLGTAVALPVLDLTRSKNVPAGMFTGWTPVGTSGKIIKATIGATTAANSPAKLVFHQGEIIVAPTAAKEGAISIKVGGTAGASGEFKVADVTPPVVGSVEKVNELRIGVSNQKLEPIKVKEIVDEAIDARTGTIPGVVPTAVNFNRLALVFPQGVVPSVSTLTAKVLEGNMQIDASAAGVQKRDDGRWFVDIPILSTSMTPATIEIDNVYVTLDRTVPEGDITVGITGGAVNQTTAWFPGDLAVGSAIVAKAITPAPAEIAGNGEFKISSNIYKVNGVAKVMDVAPYIKGDRTYVPMRYLGEILGAEVVWDDAARTVTLTKGDTTVVFTIGSTSYTVNGEAKTADVAPEIANDRTMLPARFVAEAFGAVVGWDAATQTVLIQK